MENEIKDDLKKIRFRRIRNIVIGFVLAFIIGAIAFGYFRISAGGHFALREAKNIRLASQMLAVEYYGKGKSIYNPASANGMAAGVEERLKEVIENDGDIRIFSYDKVTKTVKAFTYETGHYRVTYLYNEDGKEEWEVDYFIILQQYGGDD